MKMMFFRVNRRSGDSKRNIGISVEKILFVAFIAAFFVMVAAQAIMVTPSLRTFFVVNNEFEGSPLGLEEFLYSQGEISLQLMNQDVDNDVKVLVNGDEVAVFSANCVKVPVKDGDVVEIDGSNSENAAKVKIVSKSDNIKTSCVGKTVTVDADLKELVKLRVE